MDDYSGIKIPFSSYDCNNTLLIYNGTVCNCCYHQMCHFHPVINVPQQEWFFLIYRLKEKVQTKKVKCNMKKKSCAKELHTHPGAKLSSNANMCASDLIKTDPSRLEDLDHIYCISSKLGSSRDTFAVCSKITESRNSESCKTTQYQHNSRMERFEYQFSAIEV